MIDNQCSKRGQNFSVSQYIIRCSNKNLRSRFPPFIILNDLKQKTIDLVRSIGFLVCESHKFCLWFFNSGHNKNLHLKFFNISESAYVFSSGCLNGFIWKILSFLLDTQCINFIRKWNLPWIYKISLHNYLFLFTVYIKSEFSTLFVKNSARL